MIGIKRARKAGIHASCRIYGSGFRNSIRFPMAGSTYAGYWMHK